MLKNPNPERDLWRQQRRCATHRVLLLAMFVAAMPVGAQQIILNLKNGDRLRGTIVSEDTNIVVLTTTWTTNLVVPLSLISNREPLGAAGATNPPVAAVTPPTNAPASAPTITNTPVAPPVAVKPAPTNAPPGDNPHLPAAAIVAAKAPPPPPPPKRFKGFARIGADFLFNATDQEIFYGRFNLTYERPYNSNPKKFARNILDYTVDYGKTDDSVTANRMGGSDKTDFDIGAWKLYLYNLGLVGYDEVRKINLQWEEGPGMGYHLFTLPAFVMNVESGFNYQAQFLSTGPDNENFYWRLGEDFTWKVAKQLTLVERAGVSFQVGEIEHYRLRMETTLSYGFWQNLSLNVTVVDLYDTQPAKGVPNNDLQIRSSLGITF